MAALLQTGVVGGERVWLWVGALGMALGAAYFGGGGLRANDSTRRRYYAVLAAVPAIGTVAYVAMALGYGDVAVTVGGDSHAVDQTHYVAWLLATPLLLFALALVAEATRRTIAVLVSLDAVMVLAALASALTGSAFGLDAETFRLVLWGVGLVAYLGVVGVLLRPLSREAAQQSPEVAMAFSMLRNVVVVLWTLYLLVWLLSGTLGIVPLQVGTLATLVLDLLAMVGVGGLLLRSDAVLEQTSGALANATAERRTA